MLTLCTVLVDGTVQVFRKPENDDESFYYIPKITLVLHHFVFRTKSTCTIVSVVDILQAMRCY